jgi:hypothetical protein
MKYLVAILLSLSGPVMAHACDPLGVVGTAAVCNQAVAVQSFAVPQVAVQSHCAPVAVQSFGVAGHAVQVQSVVPFGVQTFAVAPQVVIVQNAHQRVRVQNVRQPRQVVRTRSVVRNR